MESEETQQLSPLVVLLIDDTILKVFSYLCLQDRGRTARVCQRWNVLMKNSTLWTRVNFWCKDASQNPAFAALSKEPTWEFPRKEHLVLDFLHTYCGASLKTVHLNVVSPEILEFLGENCPNVKHLSYLSPGNHSFTMPLPSFTMTMSNSNPADVSYISPRIVTLQLTFHGRQIPLMSSKKKNGLARFYKRRNHIAIKVLNIAGTSYTTVLFKHLSTCTHLRHLFLYHCSGISAAAVAEVTKSIPELQTLHLMHFDYEQSDSTTVLEDILVHIAEDLPLLKSFRYMPMIRKSAQIDDFMRKINGRQSLKRLWLPGPMLFFTSRAFAQMANGLVQLEELVLCQSGSVTDNAVQVISLLLVQLRILNLRGCNSITDAGVEYLCHNSSLNCLDLRECKGTTSHAILDAVSTIPDIVYLDMSSQLNTREEFLLRVEMVKQQKPKLTISVDFTFTEK